MSASSSSSSSTSSATSTTAPVAILPPAPESKTVPLPVPVEEKKQAPAPETVPLLTVDDLAELDIEDAILLRGLDLSETKWQTFMTTVATSYRKLRKPVIKLLDTRVYMNVCGKPQQLNGLGAVCMWLYAKLTDQERKELRTLPTSENTCNKLFPEAIFALFSTLPVRDDLRNLYEGGSAKPESKFAARLSEISAAQKREREAKSTKPLSEAPQEEEDEDVVRTSAEVSRKAIQQQGKKLLEKATKAASARKAKGGSHPASPFEMAQEVRTYVLSKVASEAGVVASAEFERLLKRYKTLDEFLKGKEATELVKVLLACKRKDTYAPEAIKVALKTDRLPLPLRAAFLRRYFDTVSKDKPEEEERKEPQLKRAKVERKAEDEDDRLMLGGEGAETEVELD